jgi:hypothetical protein
MQAALLHYYISSNVSTVADEVHKPGQLARHYQAAAKVDEVSTLEQGKEYAIEYAPGPLTQTAVFPTESLANNRQPFVVVSLNHSALRRSARRSHPNITGGLQILLL